MAKKRVKAEMLAPVPASLESRPCLYVSFEGRDVAQIKGLAIGEEIELLIKGRVRGISQRERPSYTEQDKVVKTGDIDLENYRVRVLEEDNLFDRLAEDD